jgi:hypothetical protein
MSLETYLKAADERVRNVVLEECSSLVVFAAPTPYILTISMCFTLIQNGSPYTPHDNTEDKEQDGKGRVVDGDFFSSPVTSSSITPKYDHAHEQGNA